MCPNVAALVYIPFLNAQESLSCEISQYAHEKGHKYVQQPANTIDSNFNQTLLHNYEVICALPKRLALSDGQNFTRLDWYICR